ncbi:MAG TPA: class I SAM-dependent methyltransferase [Segeticoccus sp.]|uniref:class I SAM-dependent methyltransferase n=1 Tax=Segeticoccus sp. TaxID=2706531 RepID=UPI002D7E960F|nr:class I SAM-dependent methyltransferase [Segeticoccus sp.]HET8599462.1 class I SAM-dependent methyltransferase [Segeticoccus sp.]
MTDLSRFQHPRFARRYVRISDRLEDLGAEDLRRELVQGLRGAIADIGCGDGKNFAHYPATVDQVVAVEPDATLRGLAERAAECAPVPVRVVPGHADELPIESHSLDAVVITLVLCSVPDPDTALAEVHRVLRPGGELRFGEHVRAQSWLGGAVQDLLTPLARRFDGNCHLNRDTVAALRRSELTVTRLRRFSFPFAPLLPGEPMVAGTAVKRG